MSDAGNPEPKEEKKVSETGVSDLPKTREARNSDKGLKVSTKKEFDRHMGMTRGK